MASHAEPRNVSFKYPGTDKYALRNVSFNLLPGQLCVRPSSMCSTENFQDNLTSNQVIVGANGAGKSTILKLAVRLYDPEEGDIFVDGHNVRTLQLKDLRQAISVLFQDYSHFQFSVQSFLSKPGSLTDIFQRSAITSLWGILKTLVMTSECAWQRG